MTEDPAPGPALPPPPPGAQPAPAARPASIPEPPAPPQAQPAPQAQPEPQAPGSTRWSATPATAPVPPGSHAQRGWRTTIAVATTMLVLVVGVNLVNAAIPLPDDIAEADAPVVPDPTLPVDPGQPIETRTPIDPGPIADGDVVDVGAGYTIQPPAGWVVVSQEDDVAVLQKGAVLLAIVGVPTADPPEVLATWYRDAWFADGGYTASEPVDRDVGNGIPGAELDYTGVFEGAQVDGRIVTASEAGSGLLVNAFAPTGELAAARDDLETILSSVRLGGG